MFVGAAKVVFSVVKWNAFGFACASQATAFDDDVNACCGIKARSLNFIAPVPFVEIFISPFAPSVIVILPEFVPAFVSRTKSCVPLVVRVAEAEPEPMTTSPEPFTFISTPMLVSPPVASTIGLLPVAALVISNWLTAHFHRHLIFHVHHQFLYLQN